MERMPSLRNAKSLETASTNVKEKRKKTCTKNLHNNQLHFFVK